MDRIDYLKQEFAQQKDNMNLVEDHKISEKEPNDYAEKVKMKLDKSRTADAAVEKARLKQKKIKNKAQRLLLDHDNKRVAQLGGDDYGDQEDQAYYEAAESDDDGEVVNPNQGKRQKLDYDSAEERALAMMPDF